MKASLSLTLAISIIGLIKSAQGIDCPKLECLEKPRDDLLCYKHGGVMPVNKVTFYPCPSGMICDIDYT
jgi:hypothetical protein